MIRFLGHQAPAMHQFRIVRLHDGQYGVEFMRHGAVLVHADGFPSKAVARTCIAAIKLNAARAATVDLSRQEAGSGFRFEIVPEGREGYVVRFCAADSRPTVKRSAEACIAAVREEGPFAEIVDATGEVELASG